jgi:hypothetical protein
MSRRGRPSLNSFALETDLPDLLSLWNQALSAPYGISVASQRPNTLLQKLYAARRECGHTAYHGLRLVGLDDSVLILPKD